MNKCMLILFLIALSSSTYAQRNADLIIKMTSPINGEQIPANNPINFKWIVKNQGPDTIGKGDTLLISVWIDNIQMLFFNGTSLDSFLVFTQVFLDTTDSLVVNTPLPPVANFTGDMNLCLKVNIKYNAADLAEDTIATNNVSCADIKILPVSIENYTNKSNEIDVYPNPCEDDIQLRDNRAHKKNIQIVLFDLSGKQVFSDEIIHNRVANHSIDLSKIPQGMYFITISSGNYFQKSKLIIQ